MAKKLRNNKSGSSDSSSNKRRKRRSVREASARERSFALLSDLRRGQGPYNKLLREHHLSDRTARKYLGRNLQGGGRGGRVRPSKADSRVRLLLFPLSSGDVPRRIRGSKVATKLSEFFIDRKKLRHNKLSAEQFEAKWRAVRIAGEEVFADAATILLRADFGDPKVENLYASVGADE